MRRWLKVNLMVNCFEPEAETVSRTFAALGDPTRREILARLSARDGASVGELFAPLSDRMSLPAVSKHLRVLERAGLLVQEKHGRVRRCHLRPEPLEAAAAWIDYHRRFWTSRLDRLAEFVEGAASSGDDGPPSDDPVKQEPER